MNPYRLRAYLLLIIVSIIWGIAGPVIKFTLDGLSPIDFLFYRFGLASIFALISFSFWRIKIPKNPRLILDIFLYGFLTTTASLGFLFWGLSKTTVLDMSLISLLAPLVITVFGMIFLKEHVTWKEKAGTLIAFLGSLVILIQPLLENQNGLGQISGNFLILLSVLASAFSVVLLKKLLRQNISAFGLTNLSFLIGFVTLLPIVLFLNHKLNTLNLLAIPFPYHLGVFYMAFISGTLAYYLSSRAQKTIEIGEAGLFTYLHPVFAAPLAIFWLGEKITFPFIIGTIVIILGVTIAEIKRKRLDQPAESLL